MRLQPPGAGGVYGSRLFVIYLSCSFKRSARPVPMPTGNALLPVCSLILWPRSAGGLRGAIFGCMGTFRSAACLPIAGYLVRSYIPQNKAPCVLRVYHAALYFCVAGVYCCFTCALNIAYWRIFQRFKYEIGLRLAIDKPKLCGFLVIVTVLCSVLIYQRRFYRKISCQVMLRGVGVFDYQPAPPRMAIIANLQISV